MCRIGAFPERCDAEPAHGVDKALVRFAQLAIGLDDPLEGRRDLMLRHRGTDHLTEGGETIGGAAEADLVLLLAVLIDSEYPDVAHVMMPARIHAA